MTWRQILFAVDSAGALRPGILAKVARLARAMDAEVEFFDCIYDPDIARRGYFGSRGVEQNIREFAEYRHRQLEAKAKPLRERQVKVRTTVRWDNPAYEGIVRQVLRHKPDLLIAQSTRRGRLARLMLTHSDYRLIETCPCPLLLIKTARPYEKGSIVAALDPTHSHDKPAALDEAILSAANRASEGLGAALHVYHACVPWPSVVAHSAELQQVTESLREEIHARHCEMSEAAVMALANRQGVSKEQVHVEEGDASESLPRFASRVAADMVVMGAVSRSGMKRAFIGHTAERVLEAFDCDVLIAKSPDFRSPIRRQSVHRLPKSVTPRAKYIF